MRAAVGLHHEVSGPTDAPALLLASSLGTSSASWQSAGAILAERLRVVSFDHRGHGRSPVPDGPYTIADLGADVLALLDALAIERCSFAGVSLGGMVGMWLAAHAPERVQRLVVCASSPHMPPPSQWQQRAALVREAGSTAPVVEAVLARWLTADFAEAEPQTLASLRAMLLATPAAGYAGCCEAIAAMDLREDLARVRAPVLVVCGAEDPSAPAEGHGEVIAALVPRARLVVLSPAAHLVPVERAADTAHLIFDHLDQEEAGS